MSGRHRIIIDRSVNRFTPWGWVFLAIVIVISLLLCLWAVRTVNRYEGPPPDDCSLRCQLGEVPDSLEVTQEQRERFRAWADSVFLELNPDAERRD